MSRVAALNRLYASSEAIARFGVEIIAVGDPTSAHLNAAARRLVQVVRDDGPEPWEDLLGAVRALRWRLVTQPQPIQQNSAVRDGVAQVVHQSRLLRGAVADEELLEELVTAAKAVGLADPLSGSELIRAIEEVGSADCVVVAASSAARIALEGWLSGMGVRVLTAGELERNPQDVNQAYVVGPPRFFKSSLVTAPVVDQVCFVIPAWFGDRSIPRSALAPYAVGAIRVEARVFTVGDAREPELGVPETKLVDEDEFVPQFTWGSRLRPGREPGHDEVEARKVLLSGGLAMWLDDGERIRTLDPSQPTGERVLYTDVRMVHDGTYLLLRKGETERGVLYHAALEQLGARGTAAEASQRVWKLKLAERLEVRGLRAVVSELRARGVKAADRARAWTDPNLIRPNNDHDCEVLFEWLGVPVHSSLGYASQLRRALYQASARVRDELESAVSDADLSALERDGDLSLAVKTQGFRGIVATRVLAISPNTEIVARHDARVPFEDRSKRWLE